MKGRYPLPNPLARYAAGGEFAPDELREVCKEAGEKLAEEDATEACFRSAAEMVALWRGLDLPAWEAPYILRDVRLGYLNGYDRALVSGELHEDRIKRAAEARWGEDWHRRLEAVRERSGK
ncbi:hypothetical protein BH24ACT22_BH24ACT22_14290 [soil metagenome]